MKQPNVDPASCLTAILFRPQEKIHIVFGAETDFALLARSLNVSKSSKLPQANKDAQEAEALTWIPGLQVLCILGRNTSGDTVRHLKSQRAQICKRIDSRCLWPATVLILRVHQSRAVLFRLYLFSSPLSSSSSSWSYHHCHRRRLNRPRWPSSTYSFDPCSSPGSFFKSKYAQRGSRVSLLGN